MTDEKPLDSPFPGDDTNSTRPPSPQPSTTSAHVSLLSRGMLKLYVVWIVAFQATFSAGYAVSAMTAINAMASYQSFFNFNGLGVSTGLVFSLWPISACATFWIGPIISDRYGRRGGILICSLLFILGTALIAFSRNFGMLLAGRAVLGASVCMIQASAPPYIVETSPPLSRGLLTGLFNVSWLVGSCTATAISIGTESMPNEWGWRIPMIVQLIFPILMVIGVFFIPESPRWLCVNGRYEEAKAMLTKYHGNGVYTPMVDVEYSQIAVSARTAPPAKRWDYKGLVKTRASRYRLMIALMMGAAGQLSGNGLTLFLPQLYRQIGVISVRDQLIMTLVASLVALCFATLGTYHTDKIGRRPVLIYGSLLCSIALAIAMGASAASGVKIGQISVATNAAASKAAIAFFILFGGAYAWAYQPLLGLYPTEVLSTSQRSTGMGLMALSLNAASFLNQFALPIALERIGWWTYLPYVCWDLVESASWYFLAVETKGHTLEELDQIFEAPNPVKASLAGSRHVRADDGA